MKTISFLFLPQPALFSVCSLFMWNILDLASGTQTNDGGTNCGFTFPLPSKKPRELIPQDTQTEKAEFKHQCGQTVVHFQRVEVLVSGILFLRGK